MKPIYFDNASTSFPKAPGVSDAMKELLDRGAFNINRGSYRGAYINEELVFETRRSLSNLFNGYGARNTVFTSSVTHALNVLLKGLLRSGDRVVVSSMEHNAVMRPLEQLKNHGIDVVVAHADRYGVLKAEMIDALINMHTRAVIMTTASNVCGTLLPIAEVGEICKNYNIFLIADTAQTAGVVPINMQAYQLSALAFTGHKGLLGPHGIGGMLINDALAAELTPLLAGGTGSLSYSFSMPSHLPDRLEAGTLNLPGIAGLNAALTYIAPRIDDIRNRELCLTEQFLKGLSKLNGVEVIGLRDLKDRIGVISVDFPDRDNAFVALQLEENFGIMTRCGLHCAPLAHQTLCTFPKGTVRFSFSHANTEEEVNYCLNSLAQILKPNTKGGV